MKRLLAFVLVLLAFFASYVEDIYFYLLPPQPEQVLYITFRSQRAFNFDQEKAFGSKRNVALSQYVPLYANVPERTAAAKKKMEDPIKRIAAFQGQGHTDVDSFVKYLKKELGVDVGTEAAARLLTYSDRKNLLEGVLTIVESILQRKIVEDPEPLKGKKTVDVLYAEPVRTVSFPADEFITLEKARLSLQEKAAQLFWQVDPLVLEPALRISSVALLANLQYDQAENDRRIEEIIRRYPSKVVSYQPGEVLVPFGKVLSEEDVLLLNAQREAAKKNLYGRAPWIFFAILSAVVLFYLLLSKVLEEGRRRKPPCVLVLFSLIVTIFLLKALLLLTPLSVYALPIGLLPLVLILLNTGKISTIWATVLGAVLVGLFSGRTFDILLFFAFGGLLILLTCPVIRRRSHVFVPALAVGAFNAIVAGFITMNWEQAGVLLSDFHRIGISPLREVFSSNLFANMGWAFAGGLAAGPAALLLLPLLELGRSTASTFKLNKYADLQHPLLRDLLTKSPGTYQHTMTVAYLAQAVGEAVGANTLLLRIGAYFHDIGKTADPRFFVENQQSGKNPHDDLDPEESVRIIMDHVRIGKKIGLEAGLPEMVVDFIPQHHGTLLMEYFYDRASKANPEGVLEEDFRYPGPKPQSIETAILMIVDAVEAGSRTLQERTREKIETFVRHIIEKRIADGQFDECDMSTRELTRIEDVLVSSLEATFHTRVEYPWQQEANKKEEIGIESDPRPDSGRGN